MKKQKITKSKAERVNLKKTMAPSRKYPKVLLSGNEASRLSLKSLNAYVVKHAKEIKEIEKMVSVQKILKEVERRGAL